MKFKIKKSEIIEPLSKVQGLTGRKTNLSITSNLLLQSTGSGLSITASDLDTIFEGYFPAEIENEGTITLNARKLFEITRDFPSEVIQMHELEPQWIEIKDDHVEYHIVGMNPDDFPDRPHIEDIDFFTIPSAVFKSMIEKTTFIGFPRDEKRAHIIGVYFERIEKNQNCMIRMVSTDARRLSKVDYIFSEDTNVPSFDNVLIPKAGLNEVNKFLNTPCELQIGIKNNFFIVKKENETIIISLLEGEFPDYYNLVKTEEIYSLRLNRYLFLMMLKRMSILSSEANKSVVFNLESGKLVMTTTNPDIGESREEMNIDYAREPIEVAFNPKYFIETLNSIEEEEIFLYIRDAQSPCLIEGTADKHFLSVIMPMKI